MRMLSPGQARLDLSFGGVEVLLVLAMVWFLYWLSIRMKGLARRIITLDTSAANYTVMVPPPLQPWLGLGLGLGLGLD